MYLGEETTTNFRDLRRALGLVSRIYSALCGVVRLPHGSYVVGWWVWCVCEFVSLDGWVDECDADRAHIHVYTTSYGIVQNTTHTHPYPRPRSRLHPHTSSKKHEGAHSERPDVDLERVWLLLHQFGGHVGWRSHEACRLRKRGQRREILAEVATMRTCACTSAHMHARTYACAHGPNRNERPCLVRFHTQHTHKHTYSP